MASTGWTEGPFNLTTKEIASVVTKKSAGAYALGGINSEGLLLVRYIGRADTDLADRLNKHVGKYTHFKAGYCESALAAFYKECNLFHDFGPADNKIHPDRPAGSNAKCPVCDVFDK